MKIAGYLPRLESIYRERETDAKKSSQVACLRWFVCPRKKVQEEWDILPVDLISRDAIQNMRLDAEAL